MLKVNLLPKSIYEGRNVKRLIWIFGIICIAVAAGMVAWILKLNATERELTTKVTSLEAEAKRVEQLQADIEAVKAKIPPIKAKTQYIEDVLNYNEALPKLYSDVAQYTYSRIEYSSMAANGSQLTIAAHARSLGDCGRYLMNMYRAGHLFTSVVISGVPGWPPGRTTGGMSGGMMPGMMPGMAGGMPGMGSMPGMSTMPGLIGGMPGMGGLAGGAASGASTNPNRIPTEGFDFTVTCVLRNPISAPTPPSASGTAATGTTAMGGMMPGMLMPGMPGGVTAPTSANTKTKASED